jgi:hypothetical protein
MSLKKVRQAGEENIYLGIIRTHSLNLQKKSVAIAGYAEQNCACLPNMWEETVPQNMCDDVNFYKFLPYVYIYAKLHFAQLPYMYAE